MKLCYFNDFRLGVIKGDSVVDVTDVGKDIPQRDTRDIIVGLIERWPAYKAKIEKAAADGKGVPLEPAFGCVRRCRGPAASSAWR